MELYTPRDNRLIRRKTDGLNGALHLLLRAVTLGRWCKTGGLNEAVCSLLRDVPPGRLKDVVFVDRNPSFLKKVKSLQGGRFRTVLISSRKTKPKGVDELASDVQTVLKKVLKVSSPPELSRSAVMEGERLRA